MTVRACLFACLLVSACDTTPAPDAGADAPVDAPTISDTPSDAPVCDPGTAPTGLPELVGALVVDDPDAGVMIPVLAGGDPAGVWRFDDATFVVTAEAGSMIDAAASEVRGTGWLRTEGDRFAMRLQLELVLVTTVAGTVRRMQDTVVVGSYVAAGSTLEVDVECASPPSMMSGTGGFAPSFGVEGDRGTLVLSLDGMLGPLTLILTGAHSPT